MASASRTIVFPAGDDPGFFADQPYPLKTWPMANPVDYLDYYADVSASLAEANESLLSLAVSAAPSGTGELVIESVRVSGTLVQIWMSGGVPRPGKTYLIQMVGTTATRTFVWFAGLIINPFLATYPIVPPPSLAFGTPVEWFANPPHSVPSLIFYDYLNFGAYPFGVIPVGPLIVGPPAPPDITIPSLNFSVAGNFGAYPFGIIPDGPLILVPSGAIIPSLNFTAPENFGYWLHFPGQVLGSTPPPAVPVPSLNFSTASNFGAYPFGVTPHGALIH